MKKFIKLKNTVLKEAEISKYEGDQETVDKIDRRVVRALRAAEATRQAARAARKNGDEETAASLEARAKELEEWADIDHNKFRQNDNKTKKGAENGDEDDSSDKKSKSAENDNETENGKDKNSKDSGEDSNKSSSKEDDGEQGSQDQEGSEQDNDDDSGSDKVKGSDNNSNSQNNSKSKNNSNNTSSSQDGNSGDDSDGDMSNDSDSDGDGSDEDNSDSDNSSDDNSDSDSDDDEDEDDSDAPFENPFSINPKDNDSNDKFNLPPSDNDDNDKPEKQPDDVFKRMKRALKMLKGGEKAGAGAAFKDILAGMNKNESLTEDISFNKITKDITEISDEEFEDIINDTIDVINTVKPVKIDTDKQIRLNQIKTDNANYDLNKELDDEDRENTAAEHEKVKKKNRELAKYRNAKAALGGVEDFKKMLYLAIKNQITQIEDEQDTWSVINRRHQDDDIVAPGTTIDYRNKRNAISIKMYLDCSSSFKESDIRKERSFLAVIQKFVDEGKVRVEPIVYFANNLHSTYEAARQEGGTSAWPLIVKDIQAERPDNIIIITDSDMESYSWYNSNSYTCKGCAWFIWKDSIAPNLPKRIKGAKGTYEYMLDE